MSNVAMVITIILFFFNKKVFFTATCCWNSLNILQVKMRITTSWMICLVAVAYVCPHTPEGLSTGSQGMFEVEKIA